MISRWRALRWHNAKVAIVLASQYLDNQDRMSKCTKCKLLPLFRQQWMFCQKKAQLPERMKLPAIAGIVEGHELYLPSSQDAHYT